MSSPSQPTPPPSCDSSSTHPLNPSDSTSQRSATPQYVTNGRIVTRQPRETSSTILEFGSSTQLLIEQEPITHGRPNVRPPHETSNAFLDFVGQITTQNRIRPSQLTFDCLADFTGLANSHHQIRTTFDQHLLAFDTTESHRQTLDRNRPEPGDPRFSTLWTPQMLRVIEGADHGLQDGDPNASQDLETNLTVVLTSVPRDGAEE